MAAAEETAAPTAGRMARCQLEQRHLGQLPRGSSSCSGGSNPYDNASEAGGGFNPYDSRASVGGKLRPTQPAAPPARKQVDLKKLEEWLQAKKRAEANKDDDD